MKADDRLLTGAMIGFEEYENYALQDPFGAATPFRVLTCTDVPLAFIVVNPFSILENYDFEIDDTTAEKLFLKGKDIREVAVLCVVRVEEKQFYANFRSPIIINTAKGLFRQVILQDESHGISVAFAVSGKEE